MDGLASFNQPDDHPFLIFEEALANWVDAVRVLTQTYNNLTRYINDVEQYHFNQHKAYLGQCPLAELIQLALTIQAELEKLVEDIDLLPTPNSRSGLALGKKLCEHTRHLHRLAHKAQLRLDLVSSSGC
ncbi:hypothetical protein GCM10027341_15230 [Spirosoma knui]